MFQNAVATILPSMSARSATGWSVMANLQEIAARLKVKTDYHVTTDVTAALNALPAKTADLLIIRHWPRNS
jgi:hypothetical protein